MYSNQIVVISFNNMERAQFLSACGPVCVRTRTGRHAQAGIVPLQPNDFFLTTNLIGQSVHWSIGKSVNCPLLAFIYLFDIILFNLVIKTPQANS